MNKNIKMVAFDMDGTLVDSEKRISDFTWEILGKAAKQGVVVLPATGRPLVGVPKELKDFPGIDYAVTANGARVVNVKTGETVFESSISVEKALEILDVFDDYDCHKEVFIDGASFANKDSQSHLEDYYRQESMAEYTRSTRIFVDSVREKAIKCGKTLDKVQAFFHLDEDFKLAKERLDKIEGVVATTAMGNNWEVNREGTDKGNALLGLGKILGISKDEIMACGDGMNDYEMIKKVGFGVVMENGAEELKKIADYITVTNDEDGVAKAIQKFVLK